VNGVLAAAAVPVPAQPGIAAAEPATSVAVRNPRRLYLFMRELLSIMGLPHHDCRSLK
jgi:hypothetical protein